MSVWWAPSRWSVLSVSPAACPASLDRHGWRACQVMENQEVDAYPWSYWPSDLIKFLPSLCKNCIWGQRKANTLTSDGALIETTWNYSIKSRLRTLCCAGLIYPSLLTCKWESQAEIAPCLQFLAKSTEASCGICVISTNTNLGGESFLRRHTHW